MQLPNHSDFIDAIHALREVKVSFHSKEDDGRLLDRRCAPMDFAPRVRAKDRTPVYHFWDFESDSGTNHVLSLPAKQIVEVQVLESTFDPTDFVTWGTNWAVARSSWGAAN